MDQKGRIRFWATNLAHTCKSATHKFQCNIFLNDICIVHLNAETGDFNYALKLLTDNSVIMVELLIADLKLGQFQINANDISNHDFNSNNNRIVFNVTNTAAMFMNKFKTLNLVQFGSIIISEFDNQDHLFEKEMVAELFLTAWTNCARCKAW